MGYATKDDDEDCAIEAGPCAELDALLTRTYDSLIDAIEKGEKQEAALSEVASRLGAVTQLLLLLMRYK